MTLQDLCNAFYAVDNVVTVRITMAPADWDALKAAEPHGGFCNFQFTGERFDWFHATSVEISGTALPGGPQSFVDVGISKKSFCGSFSKTKPSLRLNFSRFTDHEDAIEALIGTQYVTLHNSVQDASYIRQPLGYELFRLAGMPHSRCNIARVIVNGEDQGTYVNCEPVRKRHIQNTFGNDEGNLYEIEAGEDLTEAMVTAGRLTHQGFSDVEDGSDLLLAAQRIAAGPAAAAEVVYLPSFQRFYAMETLLKHWDGYTSNANNAYVYNDVIPIAAPDVAHVHLKFIPWGLDQILQPATSFNLDDDSVLARLVRQDPTLLDGVRAQITDLLNTVFSRDSIEGVILPYIARLETALAISGATGLAGELETVRDQVRLVRSGGLLLTAIPRDKALALVERGTQQCAHASQTETIGQHQEVYHHALSSSRSDRWFVRDLVTGHELVNEKFGTFLHASTQILTAGGNPNVYAFRFTPSDGNAFVLTPRDVESPFKLSGYLTLRAAQSGLFVRYSTTDLTGAGNPQVHLAPPAQATVLRLY
ncbi:MAG: CotH kinase family protein [Kineosporiaceae bacterium]|nr:CotH kinase family protein [Kineosporiaceae bacterium]